MKAGRPHLVYLVAVWRAGCHDRWDELDPPHGPPPPPPRLEPEPPRCPLADPVGPPGGCCCHGAQRFGHVPWFHVHDQPPVSVCVRLCLCARKSLRACVCSFVWRSIVDVNVVVVFVRQHATEDARIIWFVYCWHVGFCLFVGVLVQSHRSGADLIWFDLAILCLGVFVIRMRERSWTHIIGTIEMKIKEKT